MIMIVSVYGPKDHGADDNDTEVQCYEGQGFQEYGLDFCLWVVC